MKTWLINSKEGIKLPPTYIARKTSLP